MKAALIEFRLESATQNVREFYAGRMGTHTFFTKEAVCSALLYEEYLFRERRADFTPLTFPFHATPAMGIEVRLQEVVYKAGDQQDVGLLRYGKQHLLMPGSTFRCMVWGDIPALQSGQIILIGKKRAAAEITTCVIADVTPDRAIGGTVLPVQVLPNRLPEVYSLLAITARYAIIRVPLSADVRRFAVHGYAVPLLEEQ
jgi:hypothetical protein